MICGFLTLPTPYLVRAVFPRSIGNIIDRALSPRTPPEAYCLTVTYRQDIGPVLIQRM